MARNYPRAHRLASLIHEALAKIIRAHGGGEEIITLRHVAVNKDCSTATISYAVVGDDATRVEEQLAAKSAFYRKRLAMQLNMRNTPKLRFVPDRQGLAADKLRAFLETVTVE